MSILGFDYIKSENRTTDRLRHPDTWLYCLLVALVPNMLFLLLAPWFMVRRVYGSGLYLIAAVLALLLPRPFAYPLFLLAAAIDGFLIICLAFGMPFDLAFASLPFMTEVDVGASLLYSAGIIGLFSLAMLGAYLINRYRERLRNASLLPAIAAVVGMVFLDLATNEHRPGIPETFESALLQSAMTSDAIISNDRNVLLVLVEGMGSFADPRERDILESKLRNAAGTRFRLTHGVNRHPGSTTGAISRELCGKWGSFRTYLDGKRHDCLPSRLASAGFETISYDAFSGDLFLMRDWYPRIGMKTLNFREEMERDAPGVAGRLCGTALVGLCDEEVGKLVHRELATAGGERKFVFWLTLDSHLPYTAPENGPLRCGKAEAVIADRIPCDLTEIWSSVFDRVAAIATDPKTAPLDIMVVGDHSTPMWSRAAASHFRTEFIDWYHLEYVGEPTLG